MVNGRAIEILMDIQSDWEDGEETKAIDMAIQAIEMQIAKKPSRVDMQNKCPNIDCFESVLRYCNHCQGCGQKIDWNKD